jgi:hypothetical protein
MITSLYGISWAYVIFDTFVRTYSVKDFGNETMMYTFGDNAIFHTVASMVR